jgi:hypothetical protein
MNCGARDQFEACLRHQLLFSLSLYRKLKRAHGSSCATRFPAGTAHSLLVRDCARLGAVGRVLASLVVARLWPASDLDSLDNAHPGLDPQYPHLREAERSCRSVAHRLSTASTTFNCTGPNAAHRPRHEPILHTVGSRWRMGLDSVAAGGFSMRVSKGRTMSAHCFGLWYLAVPDRPQRSTQQV